MDQVNLSLNLRKLPQERLFLLHDIPLEERGSIDFLKILLP
jgi:hypothetical protein